VSEKTLRRGWKGRRKGELPNRGKEELEIKNLWGEGAG